MTDKIKVSKWFDEFIKSFGRDCDKGKLVAVISHCKDYETYDGYSSIYGIFNKKEYHEIRERFEDYIRAILDGDYEVEVEEEKTPLGWIPEVGERYWYVGYSGNVFCENAWISNFEKNVFQHTKVFKTKEEAEFEAEKMKVTRELEKYACEYIKEKENYCLTAHYNNRELWTISIDFDIFQGYVFKRYGLYFESEERAQEAIKAVGEDRVLKYYFGVENE